MLIQIMNLKELSNFLIRIFVLQGFLNNIKTHTFEIEQTVGKVFF